MATANHLFDPEGVCVAGTTLIVADSGNSRVLLYSPIPTSNNASAIWVIGQTGFGAGVTIINQGGSASANSLSSPAAVSSDGTRLYIADTDNNRTLIYNNIPTGNDAAANVVVGQTLLTLTSANQGGAAPTSQTEYSPTDVYSNGTTLAISDCLNNRTLIFNSIPATNSAPANVELGQPNFVSMAPNQATVADFMDNPESIMVDSLGELVMADFTNNRI